MTQTILIVDDSEHDRESHTRALRDSPFLILEAKTMAAGLAMAAETRPDLILLDYNLPDGSGLDFLRHLKKCGEAPPVVMLTGSGSEAVAVQAIKAGAYDYLIKDVEGRHRKLLPMVVERALREHALMVAKREAETRLQLAAAVFHHISEGIMATRPDGTIVSVNPALCAMTGYAAEELVGGNPRIIKSGWHEPDFYQGLWQAILRDGLWQGEVWNRRKDGSLILVHETVTAIHDAGGRLQHYMAVQVDITEAKAAEARLQELNEALVQARDRAEAASRAKSEFVASMSHEIRNPMNAILGLTRLLQDARLDERERNYVAQLQVAAQSLLGILNDILDFSKIEAGRIELERTAFSLDEVLRNIAVIISANTRDRDIETVFAVESGVPLELVGDPLRLQQVLLNLTGNALKFTSQGEVVLSVRKAAADDGTVTLAFSVRDTGIGIAPGDQERLFQAFSQADTSTSRKFGGTGLGLVISQRLVALMGGSISFTSQPGQGSDFGFTATFGVGLQSVASPGPASAGMAGLGVLVVDDNDSARQAAAQICRGLGARVETAGSGGAALERLAAGGQAPDVLVVDSRMPGMGGLEMLRRARSEQHLSSPRVILLADGASQGSATASDLPVDAVLAKPLTPAMLAEALAKCLRGSEANAPRKAASPVAGRLAGLRVLVVEDNEINRQVAREILRRAGAEVQVATDGQAALAMLAPGGDAFDAVLMDIQMPGMDGYEVTRTIRGQLGLAALPVIAMTANAMDTDRRQAAEAGMDAHIAKPIDVDRLISTLQALMPQGRKADAEPALVPVKAAPEEEIPLPADLPGIDLRTALIRLGGNRKLWISLMHQFAASQGDGPAEVRSLLAAGQDAEAAGRMHRLRGVAANLGALEVARLAVDVEAAVKDEKKGLVPDLLLDLEQAMAGVFELAAKLPCPEELEAPTADIVRLRRGLPELHDLLRESNLAAINAFAALRPAIAAQLPPEASSALVLAVESLDFGTAERLVAGLMEKLKEKR